QPGQHGSLAPAGPRPAPPAPTDTRSGRAGRAIITGPAAVATTDAPARSSMLSRKDGAMTEAPDRRDRAGADRRAPAGPRARSGADRARGPATGGSDPRIIGIVDRQVGLGIQGLE